MKTIEEAMIDMAYAIQKECQDFAISKSSLLASAVKEDWPKETGHYLTIIPEDLKIKDLTSEELGIVVHTINLKTKALQSASVCLDDLALATSWELEEFFKNIASTMSWSLKYLWEQTFQNDFIRICANHSFKQRTTQPTTHLSRRINIWGKPIPPYIRDGNKDIINPAYRRAAEQQIKFAPDTVHFLFPESREWIGKITWRNIPSIEHNPRSNIGFFRAVMTYASKPERPDLGEVITLLPKGIYGWLWYWAWKLCKFNP